MIKNNFFFGINAVLLNFLFIKESLKKSIMFSTKILSSTTVFNIDNNLKYFLSIKLAYYIVFLKDLMTLKTGVMAADNSALLSQK